MPIARIAAFVLVILGVVACSSGGGGAADPEESSYSSMLTERTRLGDELDDYINEIPAMPTEGTASYRGVANLTQNGDAYADITLIADFGNSAISGRMDNFTAPGSVKINGYADISHGRITDRDFTARLSGTFDRAELTGGISGRFYGKNAELIDGSFRAEVDGTSYQGDFYAGN